MRQKLKVCLAFFLAFAMLATYSFSPSTLTAYAVSGGQDQTQAVQEDMQESDAQAEAEQQETAQDEAVQEESQGSLSQSESSTLKGNPASQEAAADSTEEEAEPPAAVEEEPAASEEAASDDDAKDDGDKGDTDKEVKYPATSFEKTVSGMTVKINAPEGALPEGTTVNVAAVKASSVIDAVQEAVSEDAKVVKAVDITFYDKDGNEIEPEKKVSVTFASSKFGDLNQPSVVHINDDGSAEKVRGASVDTDASKATFKADEFSVYAIVDTGTDARILVKFAKPDGTEIDSMYVKKNDDMSVVLYDPGAGELANGVYFRGWTTNSDYTTSTEAKTISDVRTEVAAMLPPSEDGTVVTYYAMLFKDYRITYLDEKNISLGQEEVTFRADDQAVQNYKVNMGYTVQDDTHHFEGWNVVEGGSNISGHSEGDIYQNNDNITITGDVTFGVNAPEGHWFIFNENGKGATYNAPQFIQSGDKPTRPNDNNMIRNGYTFGGWFATKAEADQTSGGTQYDFNQTLTDKTTVYARWIPKTTAEYTVIIWRQNLAGDGYDFVEAIPLSGNVGATINTVTQHGTGNNAYARVNGTNKQYTGFHLDRFDQNVTIKTEGNSVLNVYYNRNEHTLQFQVYMQSEYTYTPTTSNNGTQYGLVDGRYVELTRHNSGSMFNPRYYWTYGDTYWSEGTRYNGTRYTRSGGGYEWTTIKEITALYGQSIGDNFPIEGTNGITYDQGERWAPQNSSTYNQVLVYIDIMPNEDVTFHLNEATHSTKHINYYVEALPGETEDTVTYNGKTFVLHKSIAANYGFFTEAEDYLDFIGFTKFGYTPNNAWGSGGANTVNCYYTRNVYPINFMDGKYVNGDGNPLDEAGMGQISTETGIAYGTDISSHNSYKPAAADTPSGFVFEGWYIDSACTQKYEFTTMPEGGVTVYAKWRQKQYRVFLHPNYPEQATGNIDWGTEDQALNFRISEGGHVSEPTGRLTGYEFVGWYLDEECTQVFNGEAYTINESNVTDDYDKSVDMTDSYDVNGNLINPKFNSDATGYEGGDRFWITKKLDIYAKWRSTLEGASGIVVEYDANGGTGAPTDTHTYVDGAKAPAGAASKSSDAAKVFGHWIVQKWNGSEWKDTETKVLPGDTFSVLAANAKVEDITNPQPGGDTKKYTVRLKAEYINSEEPTPTHIYWYKNDGNDAYVKKDNAVINVGVDIPAAPTRTGYTFLGWSRVDIGNTQEAATAWEGNSGNWTQNLDESDLYLYYNEDGTYHLNSTSGKAVTQVAPDENLPYHAMFAVWEEADVTINYAVASDSTSYEGVSVDPTSETIKAISGTAAGSDAKSTTNKYVLDYWTVDDGTEPISTDAHITPVKENGAYVAHTYYAHFKLNVADVTVHHYLKGTTTKVADDETTSETIGSQFTATPVTTYQEKNLTVDSYNPSQTVTVSENGNVITIYYTLPLTITAKTDSKTYDGTPLDGKYTITGALDSDAAAIETAVGTAPSITKVSESPLEYLTEEEQAEITGIPGYYDVSYTSGTLTIEPKAVTVKIKGNNATNEFDGEKHTVTGFTATTEDTSYDVANVALAEGSKAEASRTDFGQTDMGLKASDFVNKDTNYAVTFEIEEDGYQAITKKAVSVKIKGNNATNEYDGEEHTVTGFTATTEDTSYDVANVALAEGSKAEASRTDFGQTNMDLAASDFVNNDTNYEVTFIIDQDGYQAITKKAITVKITGNNSTDVYDGEEHTVTGFTATTEDTSYDVANVALAEGSKAEASRTDFGQTNMNLVASDFVNNDANYEVTFVIDKDGYQAITEKTIIVKIQGATSTDEYDGEEHTVTGFTATTEDTSYDVTNVALAEGSKAEASRTDFGQTNMNLAASDFVNKDSNYKVTFVIDQDGYQAITPKAITVKITGNSSTDEYDGEEHTVTGFTAATEDKLYDVKNVALAEGSKAEAARTDAGQTDMDLKDSDFVNKDANFTVTFVIDKDGYQAITPKAITVKITGNNSTDEYDGEEHQVTGFKATTEDTSYDVANVALAEGSKAEAARTNAGQTDMNLAASDFVNNDDNYTVTFVIDKDGFQAITPKPITVKIEGENSTNKYDGKEHQVTGFKATTEDTSYDVANVALAGGSKAEATRTNAGQTDMGLAASDFVNNDDNYEVTFVIDKDGFQAITARTVTMTSATDTKEYDGKALTNDEVTVTGDGFAEGEGATYNVTGSQTKAGTSDNEFSYTLNDGTLADNYTITTVNGTLTVTQSSEAITITSADKTWTYDGKEHSNPEYTVKYGDEELTPDESGLVFTLPTGDKLTISDAATVKNVSDTAENNNTFKYELENADQYEKGVTSTYGTLTIEPKEITVNITGNSDSKKYEGTELSVSGYDTVIPEGETLTADSISCSGDATASGTDVGTYEMGLTADQFTAKDENYNVTFEVEDGSLEITKRDITLTSATDEKPYDGTPLTNDKVTITGDGLAKADTITFDVTGSQTYVGSSDNTFTYEITRGSLTQSGLVRALKGAILKTADDEPEGVDVAANYNIKKVEGTLTVTDDVDNETVIKKTHEDKTYEAGDVIEFTIEVTNIYDEAKTITIEEQEGVEITGETVFENVASGETVSTTATYEVTEEDAESGEFKNTASATFDGEKTFTDDDTVDIEEPEDVIDDDDEDQDDDSEEPEKAVDTGDNSNVGMALGAMLAALLGLGGAAFAGRRRKEDAE